MRVLFFGTSEFAVPCLDALMVCDRHDVLAVVTQPDRPHGRGLHAASSPVKHVALRGGLPVLQPRRVRSLEFIETARDLAPDGIAVAAFGQIVPQALLDLPPRGPINVHGSLLPAYRGAAPIQRALMSGDRATGVTTMWMDATLDTGDILLAERVPIDDDDTAGTLTPKLAAVGAQLLIRTLDMLEAGICPREPQDGARATHAPPIAPEESAVRWSDPAAAIRNRVRALSPRPGAYAIYSGKRIKLWHVAADAAEEPNRPGTVSAVGKEGVTVVAGQGCVTLLEVQPENSRRMSAAEWARGARVTVGAAFDSSSGAEQP